jgi:tRNA/rRNA methyltransferase
MHPEDVVVVLVEPKGDANIGSVARVMKNFGFEGLRLVRPRVDHLSREARNMAVKAVDLLENASLFDDLASCLSDVSLAVGTTRRFGKYREEFIEPQGLAAVLDSFSLAPASTIAFVYGREDSGLITDELDLCQRFLTIPTHSALPSMNLAQAVAICLYETSNFFCGSKSATSFQQRELAHGSVLEGMYRHMEQTLLDIGFLDPNNPTHIMRAFRRMFNRQGLDRREVQIIRGMLSQIDWANKKRT